MIRPTPFAAALFAATQTGGLLAMVWRPESWPVSAGLGLLTLTLYVIDVALSASSRRLVVTTKAPAHLHVGVPSWLGVALEGVGGVATTTFELLAELTGTAEEPRPIQAPNDGAEPIEARLPLLALRRGPVGVEAVWIRWRGPFGLAQKTLRTPVGATIQALPDMRGLRSAAIRFDAREALSGVKPQHQIGEGSEFESLRDYAPGLDPRQIDWKRSAKHRKLLSKELTIERNHHIVLAFDTGHLTGEPIDGVTRLDRAIAAGLALAWVSLRAGDLVGAFAFDSSARFFLQPGRGMSWFERLRRGVGELGYGVAESNFTLALAELNVRLKRRTLIVLFTEFVDTTTAELMLESLKLTSARHAVVFVTLRDPELAALVEATPENFVKAAQSVVAHDFQRERAIVMERLHRLGVHCLDAPPQNVSTRLIDRYLSIKEKGQL